MSSRLISRVLMASAVSSGVALCFGGAAAFAHVGTDKEEVIASNSTTLTFAIGHGCDGSPTNSMKFQIPEGIVNAAPQVKPGWTITTERADLAQPLESSEGEAQTDRVAVITFAAEPGNEVDAAYRDTFTIGFRAPEEEGQLFFKVVQGCTEGENPWIEEWDGTGAEPEHPAPSVMVVAAPAGEEGDGHDDATMDTATDTSASSDASTDTSTAVSVSAGSDDGEGDDDNSSNGLAIVGIVVGGLGLVAGGIALARTGRPAG